MRHSHCVAILALALATTPVACNPRPGGPTDEQIEQSLRSLSLDEVERLVNEAKAGGPPIHVYDMNDELMYRTAHVPTAKWTKFDAQTGKDLPADKGERLVFYCANEHWHACHHGAVSAIKLGYTNVFIMPAGMQGWMKAKKPVETGA